MAKTAFVTGVTGQDGAYLCKLLVEKGYKVFGAVRRSSIGLPLRLSELGVDKDVELVPFDLGEVTQMLRILDRTAPEEFYNLAAQSFVGLSWELVMETTDTDAVAVARVLEVLRTQSPNTRFYQASTSEMFGMVQAVPQRENTPFRPRSPYGVAKVFAHWLTVNYRESFNMHASSGILFNHESPLRGAEFVTRKITLSLARIAHGLQERVELGNLSSMRDWGFAGDYVDGMWRMLQQATADDYVLATGETHTVRRFAEKAAQAIGIDIVWEGQGPAEIGIDRKTGKTVVAVNPQLYRPAEVDMLVGDAAKARDKLGWKPTVHIDELATMMARTDFDRVAQNTVRF